MPLQKTLIISATPPGTAGTGEALLREICLALPEELLAFFVLESLNYSLPGDTNDIKNMAIERVKLPAELVKPSSTLPLLKEISLFLKRQKYWREVQQVKERAIKFGREQGCRQVLAVLGSPTVTVIASDIARTLGAELTCLAWDPHETTMHLLHFDQRTKEKVMRHFTDCMKLSKSLAVASDGMREEYKSRYGVDGIPLIRPIRRSQIRDDRSIAFSDCDLSLTIGFCGSLYAKREFAALFEALSSVDWKIAGRPVTFKVLSNYFFIPHDFEQRHLSIQLMGFRHQDAVVEELSKCHVAYLPYWFDEARALSVRTCFPDKVGTYLTSGVPIVYHGPKKSTPSDFFAKYPIGLPCHSLDTNEILSVIDRMVTDENLRDAAWKARNIALEREFSLSSFRSKIAQLMRISLSELNPADVKQNPI